MTQPMVIPAPEDGHAHPGKLPHSPRAGWQAMICTAVGSDSHHTSSQGHPVLVQLVGVQHAQLDGQLPVLVSNDGEGQLLCRLVPVVGIDVLQRKSHGMFLWHHHRGRGQAETGAAAAGAPDFLGPEVSAQSGASGLP